MGTSLDINDVIPLSKLTSLGASTSLRCTSSALQDRLVLTQTRYQNLDKIYIFFSKDFSHDLVFTCKKTKNSNVRLVLARYVRVLPRNYTITGLD